MGLATLLAWQLPVQEPPPPQFPDDLPTIELDEKPQQQQQSYGADGAPPPEGAIHATVFAQTNRRLPEWVTVFRHFKTPNCIAFLFIAWIMGTGMGLIFSFLFWHLQVRKLEGSFLWGVPPPGYLICFLNCRTLAAPLYYLDSPPSSTTSRRYSPTSSPPPS